MSEKISSFLAERKPMTPCLVVDLDIVVGNYERLRRVFPAAEIFYAVKANPAPEILSTLVALGSGFDAASVNEVDHCLDAGASPERLSFGNTIKKQGDISHAFERGVRLFAFDSEAELEKLALCAPGARVFCRILMDNTGAEWPLHGKFGCSVKMARDLMLRVPSLGLDAYGLSFHIGSQQTDLEQWDIAIGKTANLFSELSAAGIDLRMVNLGGGFPVKYRSQVPATEQYADAIMKSMSRRFGNRPPGTMIEPGRVLAADAGVIASEVVLISKKAYDDERRWVYLDIGKFGGLIETMDENIRYRITTPGDGGETGPVVLAGPTCDGADVLYERAGYRLPLDLRVGDRVVIHSAGAYTASYASVGFNGFLPLAAYYI